MEDARLLEAEERDEERHAMAERSSLLIEQALAVAIRWSCLGFIGLS